MLDTVQSSIAIRIEDIVRLELRHDPLAAVENSGWIISSTRVACR